MVPAQATVFVDRYFFKNFCGKTGSFEQKIDLKRKKLASRNLQWQIFKFLKLFSSQNAYLILSFYERIFTPGWFSGRQRRLVSLVFIYFIYFITTAFGPFRSLMGHNIIRCYLYPRLPIFDHFLPVDGPY